MSTFPVPPTSPMFSFYNGSGTLTIINQSQIRQALNAVLKSVGIFSKFYSFHTFRRSGAALAYTLDVPLDNIKNHGTWSSDAVWTYIRPSVVDDRVAL